jgi:hypothetical protein
VFTLFDLLKLVGAGAGAFFAARLGYQTFGWPAAMIAAPLGFVGGGFIGNLPWVAAGAWMRFDLKRSSSAKLKQRLEREYFISHILIAELVSRGEPLEQFRGYVAGLLQSSNPSEQHFGREVAGLWFRDLLPVSPSPSASDTPPGSSQ